MSQQYPTSPPQSPPPPPHPSPRKIKKNIFTASPSSGGSGKHPLYHGIRSRSGKWVSEIREPKKSNRIWLGTYSSPEMAAAAYDAAALALKGGDARLNFPDNVTKYPILDSLSPQDIRRAAAIAAALMKPESGGGGIQTPPVNDEMGVYNAESVSGDQQEFMDEDALFDMPNLLMDMAGGMLLSPPRIGSLPSDDVPENYDSQNLWSYDYDRYSK